MHRSNSLRPAARLALLCALPCLAGCADIDPLYMPGRWQPTGANQANLVAEVENPADLVQGRSEPGSDAQGAAAAVARLRLGLVKPLPDTGLADIRLGHVSDPPAPVLPGIGGT